MTSQDGHQEQQQMEEYDMTIHAHVFGGMPYFAMSFTLRLCVGT
jgi:hypothetical protein